MNVSDITKLIEKIAPLALQEDYDNAGLLVGDETMEVTGALLCIDITEDVIDEAINKNCNLIISHHPLIFRSLKKLTGQNETQKCVIKAIKQNIAIYAAHTNLDNILNGVNGKIAEKLNLKNIQILRPISGLLLKLITFVPVHSAENVRNALFEAGAGSIGNYDECSYNAEGFGTFRPNERANPYVGNRFKCHYESEIRIEVILPKYMKNNVLQALLASHPYEEPVYDFYLLENDWKSTGTGLIGELETEIEEMDFLNQLKQVFHLNSIRYTALSGKKIKKVAVCGGSGSQFLTDAISVNSDIFISADFKYHEFFDAKNKILIADIGHFESEQFTKDVFYEIITKKMPTFAVRISEVNTNPIKYL